MVVAQDERATPHPPQRFAPTEFAPWVEARPREGLEVHVVYESCGFGYGLYRVAASWRALLPGHSGSWGLSASNAGQLWRRALFIDSGHGALRAICGPFRVPLAPLIVRGVNGVANPLWSAPFF